jgi:transposase
VRACDRLTRLCAVHKTRLKDLVRQLLPLSPLDGDVTNADLAVLLATGADPHHLARLGKARLTRLISQASRGHLGAVRAQHWLDAAGEAVRLFNGHPAVAFQELAEEVKTEARLLKTAEVELPLHARDRAKAYVAADPKGLARSLPGIGEVGAPNLVAAIGGPGRVSNDRQVRSFCGLTPKSSETGETDRKGQPLTKAGPSRLRTSQMLAADTARKQDPSWPRSTTCR